MLKDYYKEELTSLRELGQEFAEQHPDLAPMLLSAGADPDVDRLMQGFAFLAGRIRCRLDDDFPDVIEGLMESVAPHYVRPLPSATIMEFSPAGASLSEPQLIERGVRLYSKRVDEVSCVFRTTSDVLLAPVALGELEFQERAGDKARIRIPLEYDVAEKVGECLPERLRFYVDPEQPDGWDWLQLLTTGIACVDAVSKDGRRRRRVHDGALEPVGFDDDQALLPYAHGAFPGYRLLQEYFTLRQKFCFCDLPVSNALRELDWTDGLTLELILERVPDRRMRLGEKALRLHCAPAVNLDTTDAIPVKVEFGRSLYRVMTQPELGQEVYSMDRCFGLESGTGVEVDFPSYQRAAGLPSQPRQASEYYRLERQLIDEEEGLQCFLRFSNADGEAKAPRTSAVSMELTVTNGRRPEELAVGDIDRPGTGSPEAVFFKNLTRPTLRVNPPLGKGLLRRLVSHLILGQRSLASAEALRELVSLYDFPGLRSAEARRATSRLIESIRQVETKPTDRLLSGCLVRGVEVRLGLSGECFASTGALHLFGSVLDQLFGLNVAVNRFTRLVVTDIDREESWAWPSRSGRLSLV